MTILEIDNLTMRFGGLTAVNRFCTRVEKGQIFSIIGPNGAGKTTAFNAITGIYEPTEGHIRFEGHRLTKPFTWKVVVGCILIGLLTSVIALLSVVNVDKLWKATIKRNHGLPDRKFTYTEAWHDFWSYLNSELALERTRSGMWIIVTADGKQTLSPLFKTEEEAERARGHLQEIVNAGRISPTKVTRPLAPGKQEIYWIVMLPDATQVLTSFATEDAAQARIAELNHQANRNRLTAWVALLGGLALGIAGFYTIWGRSRRTPDVIALGGIARTFQNIRLFQNMTVVENVLMGMDRSFRVGVIRMMLRTPGVRKEEKVGRTRALDLLTFVGLGDKAQMLAKNLPYGDQRRLEIARALATNPRLLLLDEPAAGMNPSETGDLMELIQKIRAQEITVLLIEHHMNVVMGISDRIAVLDYGVKIAEGTPEEVRSNPKVIEAYLGKEDVG